MCFAVINQCFIIIIKVKVANTVIQIYYVATEFFFFFAEEHLVNIHLGQACSSML